MTKPLRSIFEMTEQDLLKELHTGLIRWYPFGKRSNILFVEPNAARDPMKAERADMAAWLEESGHCVSVICPEEFDPTVHRDYDYVCLPGVLEFEKTPEKLLKKMKSALKSEGKLLIGTDNRFSIRYFSGDHDLFTDRSFDGIENYENLFQKDKEDFGGRSYARFELDRFLKEAGISVCRFYSVFPDIRYAQLIYAEDYAPNEELVIRYFPMYNHPSSVFLFEEKLLNPLAANGMLHKMANGYLIECAASGEGLTDILHATLALDRGEDSMATMIRRKPFPGKHDLPEGTYDPTISVEKIPYGSNATKKLQDLLDHAADLNAKGLHTVPAQIVDGHYMMPYMTAVGGIEYFKDLAKKGRDAFLVGLDHFWEVLLRSSEEVDFDPEDSFGEDSVSGKPIRCRHTGPVLKTGYLDLMPLNAFVVNDEFYFYDQEFAAEKYPAKAILMRAVGNIYSPGKLITNAVPYEEVLDRYDLKTDQGNWYRLAADFTNKLRHETELYDFTSAHVHDPAAVSTNRERISFSVTEYQRLFVELFRGLEGKDLILFGTGAFTRQFLSMFAGDVSVKMLLDNNREKHGKEMDGIPIVSPEVLKDLNPDSYKLIICIKQYVGALQQIKPYGVKHLGIFDPYTRYEMPRSGDRRETVPGSGASSAAVSGDSETGEKMQKKPYHTGYISGVFDLFHIGHLNLLRRAKGYCDHLIVGVSTDEWVRKFKGTDPVVPFEERRAIVEACRYVDEAVEIPTYANDALNAWRKYRFDVQFSGSDYEHDKGWLDVKAKLEENGATVMFFPYTEGTSTTKRKERLRKQEAPKNGGDVPEKIRAGRRDNL